MLGIRNVAALTLAGLVAASVATARPAQGQPDLSAALDKVITARIAQMGVPGAVVSLSVPGEIDYVKAFGVADTKTRVPMSVDDYSRIGSVTKTFTGTAVLQLVDQGRISLADPISRYVDGVPSGDVITLDMLGRMRSGLPDYTETDKFVNRVYAEAPSGPDAFATTPRELVDAAFTRPLEFPPNTQWQYSNTNFLLLGMVVQKVTGMPFGDYLQQNIFGPLGLMQTSYPANGDMPDPYAHGYTQAPDGTVYDTSRWNPSWGDAAGKIVSTAADMRRWAPAVARGALLAPWTQAQRVAAGSEIAPGVDYAFAIFDAEGWLGHNGDIPGYATVAVYLPERDATLVVFVNSDSPQPHAAGQLATDITGIATPDHVYQLEEQPPLRTGS
jgi:D-alanyl-D-alanine carboxypeptidase